MIYTCVCVYIYCVVLCCVHIIIRCQARAGRVGGLDWVRVFRNKQLNKLTAYAHTHTHTHTRTHTHTYTFARCSDVFWSCGFTFKWCNYFKVVLLVVMWLPCCVNDTGQIFLLASHASNYCASLWASQWTFNHPTVINFFAEHLSGSALCIEYTAASLCIHKQGRFGIGSRS